MKRRSVYLLALTAILLWSTAGTAFKLALRGISFIQLLFLASTTAWVFLLIVMLFQKKVKELRPESPRQLLHSAIGGFLNPFLYYMILLKAYDLLPAQIAGPLNYSWPVMLVLLSIPFLGQKIKLLEITAILISFLGVIVISAQGKNIFNTPITEPTGVALALVSSVVWASFWIFNVRDRRSEISKITLNFFFGSLFSGAALLLTQQPTEWNIYIIPAIYVGLTEMAIAFVCWLTALENSKNTAQISNLVFISPFLSLFFIHLILGEKIYWTTPAGLVLIVGGILFQQLVPARTRKNEH